jgi:hypothetical protein
LSGPEKKSAWEAIVVGEDLGTLEYVLTEQMVANYRRVVDNPHAAYPTVAARHPANLFYRKYRHLIRVPNAGQESQYFNPPVPGETVFVSARIVDKYVRREKNYLVIEATAKNPRGELIEISRLIGLARETSLPALEAVAKKWEQPAK